MLGGYILKRQSYRCQLCSSSGWLLPLFVWGRLHTGASQETQNETSPILLFHLPVYRWCTFTIIYHKFVGFVDHICFIEFEINDTQTQLGLLHTITYTLKHNCRLRTKLRQRDEFNDTRVNFAFICSNIPGGPANGVYISHSGYEILEIRIFIMISLRAGCS